MSAALKAMTHALSSLDPFATGWMHSTVPFVLEDNAPPGCTWEMDYRYRVESMEDAPVVEITALRFVAHDGTEYPIRIETMCGRWVADFEAVISDEVGR